MRGLNISLIVLTVGCTNNHPININIESYNDRDSEPELIESELDILKEGDFISYRYRDLTLPDSVFNYLIRQKRSSSDSIVWFETMVPRTGVDTFISGKTSLSVFKYEYNIVGAADEELEIFFVPKHGLVLMKSLAWGFFSTFSNNNSWSNELNSYILKDTSGFYFDPPIDFESLPHLKDLLEDEELSKILEDDWNDSAAANNR